MIAIVDCNNFYCGCERLFKPKLEKRPVVVLSNNDGCIISRTDEAKALGIGMAGPYFLVKDIIQQNNIEVFSSNYNLYGDISWRVMRTLKELAGEEIDMIIDIEADELAMDIPFDNNLVVLDVRKPAEFAEGHVKDALNIPLHELIDPVNIASLEEDQNVYVHCQGGYRSVIATSLLKRQGIHNIRNVLGGWNSIKEQKKIETQKEKSVLN